MSGGISHPRSTRPAVLLVVAVFAAALAVFLGRPARVPGMPPCPEGTTLVGDAPPRGDAQGCAKRDASGQPVRHGPYVRWYRSGRKALEGEYRDGEKTGRWTFWHANGQKKEQGEFREGRERGVWRRWHETGALLDEGEYQGGVRAGRWTLWHASGRKAREGEYRNGEASGRWAEWNVRGERCDPEAPGAARG